MKFCSKCGKELMDEAVVCPNCGCAVEIGKDKAPEVSYDQAVKGAFTTNIISAVVIVLGVILGFFVSILLGAVLILAAELIALIPNTKVQKALKKNGLKSADKKEKKAIIKDLKAKNPAYKFSMILAVAALILLILLLACPYFLALFI